jgi:hypothetical protein
MNDRSASGLIALLQAFLQNPIWRLTSVLSFLFVLLHATSTSAQTTTPPDGPTPQDTPQLQVNWLYGVYVPKDEPLNPLTGHQSYLFAKASPLMALTQKRCCFPSEIRSTTAHLRGARASMATLAGSDPGKASS